MYEYSVQDFVKGRPFGAVLFFPQEGLIFASGKKSTRMENVKQVGPCTGVVLSGWTGNSVWQRLELVLHKEGTCVEAFEKGNNIGHLGGWSLFDFKVRVKPNFKRAMVSDDPAVVLKWILKVLGRYPKYSFDWFRYGEGHPLREPFRK